MLGGKFQLLSFLDIGVRHSHLQSLTPHNCVIFVSIYLPDFLNGFNFYFLHFGILIEEWRLIQDLSGLNTFPDTIGMCFVYDECT